MNRIVSYSLCMACLFLASCQNRPWPAPALENPLDIRPAPLEEPPAEQAEQRAAPLEVADLLDLALRRNPATMRAWANVQLAGSAVGSAESRLYPSLNVLEVLTYSDSQSTHSIAGSDLTPAEAVTTTTVPAVGGASAASIGSSIATPFGYNKYVMHNLSVSYLLLDFGGRQANISSARQALYAAKWQRERMMQEVVVAVLKNYYLYMGYKALVKARHSDVKNATANFELAQHQFKAGVKPKLDMLQTSAAWVDAKSRLVEAEGNERIAWGNLMVALGMPANAAIAVQDLPEQLPINEVKMHVDYLVKLAETQRPDLAAAMADYKQAEEQVAAARSAGLPVLFATGNVTRAAFFNNPSQNLLSSQATLAVSIPLFSGFYFEYLTKGAKAHAQSVWAELERKQLDVTLEVVKNYYDFMTASDRTKFSEEFLEYSQEAYDAAFVSYKEGVLGIVDLLVAQRDLSVARAQRIESRTRWAIALAMLSFATGTL